MPNRIPQITADPSQRAWEQRSYEGGCCEERASPALAIHRRTSRAERAVQWYVALAALALTNSQDRYGRARSGTIVPPMPHNLYLLEDHLLSVDNSSLEVRNEVEYENSQRRLKMVDYSKSEVFVGKVIYMTRLAKLVELIIE